MNHGLVQKKPQYRDLVEGTNRRLGAVPITDGHWAAWLPAPKDQQINGVEPYDCVSHGTLKCAQILIKQEYGEVADYSERFLAKMTGTDTFKGNDPSTVAQFLKRSGCTLEQDWPTSSSITTFEEFYASIPLPLQTKALEFVAEFAFGHQWLPRLDQAYLMDQLRYSPLGVGVYAWQQDPNTGYYVNPSNLPAEHFVTLYDFEPNNYWLVFDSYSQEIKKLAWDFPFAMAKEYTIHRQIVNEGAWQTFLDWMTKLLPL